MKRFAFLLAILCLLSVAYGCAPEDSYTGEQKDGLPHGEGTMVYPNGAVYEGEFCAGLRCGEGTWEHPNSTSYAGHWSDDHYHGPGTLFIPGNFTYEGLWDEGLKHGYGIKIWPDGSRYEGNWENGLRQGPGTLYYPDGSYYEGEWSRSQRDGFGTFYKADGSTVAGQWKRGNFLYIAVEKFALSATELSLTTNSPPHQLEAFILPPDATNKDVTWTSSSPQVADVSAGLVTPVSAGTAVITAKILGEDVDVECLVSVVPPPVAVSEVNLNPGWLTLTAGQDPIIIEAVIEPANATDLSLIWVSSDPEIAAVNQFGLVTPRSPGRAEITVRTDNGEISAHSKILVREVLFTLD